MGLTADGLLPRESALFGKFLDHVNDAPDDPDDVYLARNAFLDERITALRASHYGEAGALGQHSSVRPGWADAHERYLRRWVGLVKGPGAAPIFPTTIGVDCPESFDSNTGNSVALADDLALLRLVRFPSSRHIPLALREFSLAVRRVAGNVSPNADDVRLVDAGLAAWDSSLYDLRPQWVALWIEARELFGAIPADDDDEWPNKIRDRCGLVHLDPPTGRPVSVILLRYRVSRIPQWRSATEYRLIAIPSILDGEFYPAFCPPPREEKAGRVVNLSASGDAPNREYVHAFMNRTAADIFRVGEITRPAGDLAAARRAHLDVVRRVAARPDYGVGTG